VGRTPGATAASTRERLLRAAADVFGRRGYAGTRVSEIAEAAGLSNGALYAYFGSRAELLVDALRAHGQRMLTDLISADPTRSISDLLLQTGRSLHLQREPDDQLVIEALIAARRDELDLAIAPSAVAHFCLSLAAGTALVSPDLNDVDDTEWAALLTRLLAALAPPHPTEEMGTAG